MHEPPTDVTDEQVRRAVRDHWDTGADTVRHLPVGFGAHHWRVDELFVTLDRPGGRHTPQTLEATYAGAAALADQGLGFVLAPLRSRSGRFTEPLGEGLLSVTPWTDSPRSPTPADEALLARLHATPPLPGLRRWRPLVGAGLAEELATRTAGTWRAGRYGEQARRLLREHLPQVAGWTRDYHELAGRTDPSTWVNTHGEPHARNLLLGPSGPLLVDWESLLVAPRERDLRQADLPGDLDLLRLFDLEWRLDEVTQYADRFEQPHDDGPDARTSLAGLRHELARP